MPGRRAETLASIVVLYRQRLICKTAMPWNTIECADHPEASCKGSRWSIAHIDLVKLALGSPCPFIGHALLAIMRYLRQMMHKGAPSMQGAP